MFQRWGYHMSNKDGLSLQKIKRLLRSQPLEELSSEARERIRRSLVHLLAEQSSSPDPTHQAPVVDVAEISGLDVVKRALVVAAAGGHHLLIVGPPQSGKTLCARALPGLLPADTGPVPFRMPPVNLELAPFMGHVYPPTPGELTLAHDGVLVMRHLSAWKQGHRRVLMAAMKHQHLLLLRPEDTMTYRLPTRFLLVATTYPCPCGYKGHATRPCDCSPSALIRHQQRFRGWLRRRFSMVVHAEMQEQGEPSFSQPTSSGDLRRHVQHIRRIQMHRYAHATWLNSDLWGYDKMNHFCTMSREAARFFKQMRYLRLLGSHPQRILPVARTIADLADSATIEFPHLNEALSYQTPSFLS